jgi:uncharacterized protein (DUF697 family)
LAHGLVGVATTAGAVVGAVPIPFPDATFLLPLEIGEVNGIAQIYGIKRDEKSKQLFDSIIQAGSITVAAKAALNVLKAVPGINLAASALNGIVAGAIVAALGESTIYAFEQVYLGKKSIDDIDWIEKVIEARFTSQFLEAIKSIGEKIPENADMQSIAKIIMGVFMGNFVNKEVAN